jgi:hypothetical protein
MTAPQLDDLVPFGPRLIGETEKTLNAILADILSDTGLDEGRWVTLRLASLAATPFASAAELAATVADRAHFANSGSLVDDLTSKGLLLDGAPTAAGRRLAERIQREIASRTAPIWEDLPPADVAAACRTLNEVMLRARAVVR